VGGTIDSAVVKSVGLDVVGSAVVESAVEGSAVVEADVVGFTVVKLVMVGADVERFAAV